MRLRMFIMGVVASAILMIAMVATRLMKDVESKDELVLRKLENVTLTPPPEPEIEPMEEPEIVEDAPPVSLELSQVPVMDAPRIPPNDLTIDPSVEVEIFSSEVAVAELPVLKTVKKPAVRSKPKRPVKPSPGPKVTGKPSKPEPVRSRYSVGELDSGMPSVVRRGRLVWPRGVRDNVVRARLRVEIDQSGRVRVLSVDSITNPRMRAALMRFVSGTRFTPPKKNGRAVKTEFSWPLTLQKPR